MEQLHFITKLLDIKNPNIKILDIINMDTHKEIIAKLDYEAPSCPDCGSLMKKYDFQKPSKIPYLETTGMPSRILLRKRRFKCYHCSKMMVAETPLVKKNHQKLIKRNAFGFRNFENFKKRIFIALNIKKERTKFVLSQA